MKTFLSTNATAVFALTGALLGSLLSFGGSWMLKYSDLRLRLLEKVLNRRIEAHERIMKMCKNMRTMVALSHDSRSGELTRAPYFFRDQNTFDQWYVEFSQAMHDNSTWLTIELTRELYFTQDYVVNLHEFLKKLPSDRYFRVGSIIYQDFIDLSDGLEKRAFDFFSKDLSRLKLNDLRAHHKYPKTETMVRLDQTQFRTRHAELQKLATE